MSHLFLFHYLTIHLMSASRISCFFFRGIRLEDLKCYLLLIVVQCLKCPFVNSFKAFHIHLRFIYRKTEYSRLSFHFYSLDSYSTEKSSRLSSLTINISRRESISMQPLNFFLNFCVFISCVKVSHQS